MPMPMPGASGEPYVWALVALVLFAVLVGLVLAGVKLTRAYLYRRHSRSLARHANNTTMAPYDNSTQSND